MKLSISIVIIVVAVLIAFYTVPRSSINRFIFGNSNTANEGISLAPGHKSNPESKYDFYSKTFPTDIEKSFQHAKNDAYDSRRKWYIQYIGKELQEYYREYHSAPNSLQTLVDIGLVRSIPVDPVTQESIKYQILNNQPQMCEISLLLSTGEKIQAFCAFN